MKVVIMSSRTLPARPSGSLTRRIWRGRVIKAHMAAMTALFALAGTQSAVAGEKHIDGAHRSAVPESVIVPNIDGNEAVSDAVSESAEVADGGVVQHYPAEPPYDAVQRSVADWSDTERGAVDAAVRFYVHMLEDTDVELTRDNLAVQTYPDGTMMVWLKNPFMAYDDDDDLTMLSEVEYDALEQFDAALHAKVYNFVMHADERGMIHIDHVLYQLWGTQIDMLDVGGRVDVAV
mgnify:CR=1 FL=1